MNNISPEQALELITNQHAVLVDVRTSAEFEQDHIADARSLPLNSIEQSIKQLSLKDEQLVILQCQKGLRGEQARNRLKEISQNPSQFFNLTGGIEAWKQAGLPTISSASPSTTMAMPRQVQITSGLMVLLFTLLSLSGASWAIYVLAVIGTMMVFSGASGWCGMVKVLMKMPWNK